MRIHLLIHTFIYGFTIKKENYSKYNDLIKSVIDSQETFIFFSIYYGVF